MWSFMLDQCVESAARILVCHKTSYERSEANNTKSSASNSYPLRFYIDNIQGRGILLIAEYVLLHELAHLRVKDHGPEFTAILDEFMPYWRDIRKELNDSTLDYLPEAFE